VGDDRAKIAQLEEQKSKLGRAAPEVSPQKETEVPDRPDDKRPPQRSPVLTLRDASPRGHEITPETVDPSLPHDPAGTLARPTAHGAFRDEEADHRHDGSKRLKLALSGKDYEYLFGKEAKAERQLVQKERSTRLGKYARGAARVRSALENFITEVKPGNQTALNTRAAPFATFIARMHRNIHQLWGFGTLVDWEELPASSPLNDESLVTTLEIELNRDGTVSKVSMVRASKYLPFDAAAIDVVLNAAPYPEPPREIRSGNGKIYVHWSFFRDGHQCATSGVDYFILDNAPKGGDVAGSNDRNAAPSAPAVRPPGPKRLERKMGEANERRMVAESLPEAEREPASPAAPRAGAPTTEPADNQDQATKDFAQSWFASFARGDISAMTARAAYPFRSSAGVAAKSREELAQMLANLIAETSQRASAPVSVETAASLRKLIGKLPPGLDDGSGTLFAVTRIDNDMMILLLAKTGAGWKATGLIRR
jgi:TonB family protein